jgi:hypothetical protein
MTTEALGNTNAARGPARLPGSDLEVGELVPVARIYRPAPQVGRGGLGRFGKWVLEFDRTVPPQIEWLMGWTESADPFQPIRLYFPDLQSAIEFAGRHGWRYELHDAPVATSRYEAARKAARHDVSSALARVQTPPQDISSR